jgi:hypothetical protein
MSKPLDPTPPSRIERWLSANDEVREERLGLVGNEPLLHPDIDRIVRSAREHGFTRFDVLTTGEPLSDPSRCRDLFDLGLKACSLPLWAVDAATHDAITRSPGSHAATLEAIENLKSLGAEIHVHANLLLQNLSQVRDLESFVADELGLPFCIIPVRPKDANLPYAELAPRYSDIEGPLHSLVAFPLCVVSRVQETLLPPPTIISDVLKVYVLDQPFVKPPPCRDCPLGGRCVGTFTDYLDLYGPDELTPLP